MVLTLQKETSVSSSNKTNLWVFYFAIFFMNLLWHLIFVYRGQELPEPFSLGVLYD